MKSIVIKSGFLVIFYLISTQLFALDNPQAIQVNGIDIKGSKPETLAQLTGNFPNEQAVNNVFWAPMVDQGYVMQGLTLADEYVLISAYKSSSPSKNTGPTRVFQMNSYDGSIEGYFDLPSDVTHAGGLAYLGGGRLVVSDTRKLYDISLFDALADKNTNNAIRGKLKLSGRLRGSGLAYDGTHLVTIRYDSKRARRAYYLSPDLFRTRNNRSISQRHANRYIKIPAKAQGAAFDPNGDVWVSFSSSKFGRVEQYESRSGKRLNSYDLVAGLEDIGFSIDGTLWAMSESGAIRFGSWATKIPVVFSLDSYLLITE